jgi:hypothetical protein
MDMTTTEHTPTPWPKPEYGNDVGPNDEGFWEFWEIDGVGRFDIEANAAFIVRACNAHDQLVTALTDCVAVIVGDTSGPQQVQGIVAEARAALAKAQEGA